MGGKPALPFLPVCKPSDCSVEGLSLFCAAVLYCGFSINIFSGDQSGGVNSVFN